MSYKEVGKRSSASQLPSKMVIRRGGPNGEDVELPLKYRHGVPVYTKKVGLLYEKLFGLKRSKK